MLFLREVREGEKKSLSYYFSIIYGLSMGRGEGVKVDTQTTAKVLTAAHKGFSACLRWADTCN